MDIKVLQASDFQESVDLISYAFCMEFTEQLTTYWKSNFHELYALGIFENKKLLAQLTILELETYINGQKFSSGGITRVCSWPQNRRKGYVKQLLLQSLKDMREKKQSISYLAPFDFGFYEKFGWVNYSEYKKYIFTNKNFPKYAPVEGYVKITNNYEDVTLIYNGFIKQYNGSLVRDAHWYENHTLPRKKGQTAVYYNEQHEPEGYILYKIHNLHQNYHPKDFPTERQITVLEFAHTSEEARRGLINFIATHDAVAQTLVMTVPKDDLLGYTLPSLEFKQELVPYYMTRIVDVEQFISQYRFNGEHLHLKIAIDDDYAPWNEGVFELNFEQDDVAHIKKVEDSQFDLKLNIQDLSAVLLGAQSLQKLHAAQRVIGDVKLIEQLDNKIPKKGNFIVDFF